MIAAAMVRRKVRAKCGMPQYLMPAEASRVRDGFTLCIADRLAMIPCISDNRE